jgi:hypothetical protein
MMTRRELLRGTIYYAGVVVIPANAAKGEFWNDKQPETWTATEIDRLVSRSPWAKDAELEFNPRDSGPDGPPGGIGGGARPGGFPEGGGPPGAGGPGGGGFPGGDPGGGGGFPGGGLGQFKAVIRWESAKPIREARKKALPEDIEMFYALSLTGGPMLAAVDGRGRNRDDRPEFSLSQWIADLQKTTLLLVKGKDAMRPERIEEFERGMLFLFSRDDRPIRGDNKEVLFQTKMGPLELKVKFALKEMVYRGHLEL